MRGSAKPKRTGPVGGGPGARWALAVGGLLVGIGGVLAIPPPPPAASAAVGTAALSASVGRRGRTGATGDPTPATRDEAAAGRQQVGPPQAGSQQVAIGQSAPDGTAPAAAPADAPTLLDFPELHESAPVAPVSVADDGSLGIPDNPQILGWWRGGAAPGAAQGAVVVDGHVDSDRYGIGFFVNLRDLRPGEHVVLTDGHRDRDAMDASSRPASTRVTCCPPTNCSPPTARCG